MLSLKDFKCFKVESSSKVFGGAAKPTRSDGNADSIGDDGNMYNGSTGSGSLSGCPCEGGSSGSGSTSYSVHCC